MNNYKIISDQIGCGNIGKVFQIQELQPPNKILIAKIFDEKGREQYNNEKEILTILSHSNEPFNECIIKYKTINISLDFTNYFSFNSKYLIFDYLEHGNLSKYLHYMDILPEIPEKFIKLIGYKLLKALQIIHNKNICHSKMDINNIMFDNDFNPIIIHFSEAYIANNKNFRKDFEQVGIILAKLMTSGTFMNFRFNRDLKIFEITDNQKRQFRDKKFWKYFEGKIPKEFIDFFNILTKTKIINIDDLFKNDWIKEIQYKDNNYIKTENNFKIDFEERYKRILDMDETNTEINVNSVINMHNNFNNNSLIKTLNSDRCTEYINEEKNIFNLEIKKIKNEPKGILFDYIQIIINMHNDCNSLNIIYNYICELQSLIKEIDKNIKIDYPDKFLSFNVTFEEIKTNEINEANNDEEINNDDCDECKEDIYYDEDENDNEDLVMNIKLLKYNSENEYEYYTNKEKYYLIFNYIQGEISDYYYYLKIIKKKANSLLKINK